MTTITFTESLASRATRYTNQAIQTTRTVTGVTVQAAGATVVGATAVAALVGGATGGAIFALGAKIEGQERTAQRLTRWFNKLADRG